MRRKDLGILLVAVPFLGLLLPGPPAQASALSQQLTGQALVAFHSSDYPRALRFLDKAVAADAQDPQALYYRGVTQGRLSRFEAAAADLTAALALAPALSPAMLELGYALYRAGSYSDAVRWLERAQTNPELEARASLFIGMAQGKLGRIEAAKANLLRAAIKDPALLPAARFNQGLIEYRQGEESAARESFRYVATAASGKPIAERANAWIARLDAAPEDRKPERHYELSAAIGFQYDSNVAIFSSDDGVRDDQQLKSGITNEEDGRATISLGAQYFPLAADQPAQLAFGYRFFQSLHTDLSEFDIQDHRASVELSADAGPLRYGVSAAYDYYFLDMDSFLQQGTVVPWAGVEEGSIGRTDVYYRYRLRDFLKRPYGQLRDGMNHAVGMRQFINLGNPQRYLSFGYRFDREDPDHSAGEMFGFRGYRLEAGLTSPLGAGLSMRTGYAYKFEDYDEAASSGREDDEQRVSFVLRKPLNDRLAVTGAYFGQFNHSNKAEFRYRRHVGSLSLEMNY